MAQYKRVTYKPVEEFINMVNQRDPDASNVTNMLYGPDNVSIRVFNDRDPLYWTSFDDEYIVFDSFDLATETTINASKTQVFVSKSPSIVLDDTTVIDLPGNLVPYLHAMVEARAFANKQIANPKAEQRERRSRVRSQRNKYRHQRQFLDAPHYGRK